MRRYKWRILAAVIGAQVLGFLLPGIANASLHAGPWDVKVGFVSVANGSRGCTNGGGCLAFWVRMSIDSDDYAFQNDQTEYVACIQWTPTSGSVTTSNLFTWKSATGGSGLPTNYYIGQRDQTDSVSTQIGGTVNKVWVRNGGSGGTSCAVNGDSLGTAQTIRARSVVDVPAGQISSSATPSLPLNAGVAAPTADATNGVPVCSRTLSNTQDMTGQFKVIAPDGTATTATQTVWSWGDGTTNTTVTGSTPYLQNHTYGALSTMPTNGWTATATTTYTATNGHEYAPSGSGVTTGTATCAVRVDFLNPSESTAATTGTGAASTTGDTGLDACLPSGWQLLNPLAFVGGLGCVFKYLLVPSSTTQAGFGTMWGDLTTKAPFSVIYEVVTYIPGQLTDMAYATQHNNGQTGATADQDTDTFCKQIPHYAARPAGFCDASTLQLDTSGYNTTHTISNVRNIFLWVLGLLFAYACYRGVGEILK